MSLPPRITSPLLIPNTTAYLWGTRITQLPYTIAKMSVEGQKKFIEAIKSTEKFSMRILTAKEREEVMRKNWSEISKNIPKDGISDVFLLIRTVGTAVLIIFAALEVKSRL